MGPWDVFIMMPWRWLRNSKCCATLNDVLQMGASKIAANLVHSHFHLKEQLWLPETHSHFGGVCASYLKNVMSRRQTLNANWPHTKKRCCRAIWGSTLKHTLNTALVYSWGYIDHCVHNLQEVCNCAHPSIILFVLRVQHIANRMRDSCVKFDSVYYLKQHNPMKSSNLQSVNTYPDLNLFTQLRYRCTH